MRLWWIEADDIPIHPCHDLRSLLKDWGTYRGATTGRHVRICHRDCGENVESKLRAEKFTTIKGSSTEQLGGRKFGATGTQGELPLLDGKSLKDFVMLETT